MFHRIRSVGVGLLRLLSKRIANIATGLFVLNKILKSFFIICFLLISMFIYTFNCK